VSVGHQKIGQWVNVSVGHQKRGQWVSVSVGHQKNRSVGKWISRSLTILTVENAIFGSPGYRIDLKLILSKVLGGVGKILAVAT